LLSFIINYILSIYLSLLLTQNCSTLKQLEQKQVPPLIRLGQWTIFYCLCFFLTLLFSQFRF